MQIEVVVHADRIIQVLGVLSLVFGVGWLAHERGRRLGIKAGVELERRRNKRSQESAMIGASEQAQIAELRRGITSSAALQERQGPKFKRGRTTSLFEPDELSYSQINAACEDVLAPQHLRSLKHNDRVRVEVEGEWVRNCRVYRAPKRTGDTWYVWIVGARPGLVTQHELHTVEREDS